MADGSGSGDDPNDVEPPWHERTSTVLGASVAALAAIGVVWLAISYFATDDEPAPTPQYFFQPNVSGSSTYGTTTTSTETITSTSPPVTTDINPGDTTTTSSSDTSSSTTPPRTRTSTTTDDNGSSTTRRPRFNETRTLYPRP